MVLEGNIEFFVPLLRIPKSPNPSSSLSSSSSREVSLNPSIYFFHEIPGSIPGRVRNFNFHPGSGTGSSQPREAIESLLVMISSEIRLRKLKLMMRE